MKYLITKCFLNEILDGGIEPLPTILIYYLSIANILCRRHTLILHYAFCIIKVISASHSYALPTPICCAIKARLLRALPSPSLVSICSKL